jgi:hypothetical protein
MGYMARLLPKLPAKIQSAPAHATTNRALNPGSWGLNGDLTHKNIGKMGIWASDL